MKIHRISFRKDTDVLVSVVIPTIKKDVVTIRSVKEVVDVFPRGLEVIIVRDSGPKLEHRTKRSGARNRGVDVARGDMLFFMDDDISFQPDDFKNAINILLATKRAVTGGVYVQAWTGVPMIGTRFLALRKDVFKDIGGFDESLCAFEDWEFCMRAFIRGYKIIDCGVRSEHHHERSFRDLFFRNIMREAYGTLAITKYVGYLPTEVLRWFFPLFVRHPALVSDLWRNSITRAVVRIISFYYWSIRRILMALQRHIVTPRSA